MSQIQRMRKIGSEKAHLFNKHFDKIYDYWKDKAVNKHKYYGELRFIKESGKINIYIILKDIDQFTERDDF